MNGTSQEITLDKYINANYRRAEFNAFNLHNSLDSPGYLGFLGGKKMSFPAIDRISGMPKP